MKGASAAEVAKFAALNEHWHNPNGPLRSLHMFNPLRVQYVNQAVKKFGKTVIPPTAGGAAGADKKHEAAMDFYLSKNDKHLVSSLTPQHRVLDVGCGGGILAEPLSRMGANVLGIDVVAESIAVAEQRRAELIKQQAAHYADVPAMRFAENRLQYRQVSLFDLLAEEEAKAAKVAESKEASSADADAFFDVVVATEVIEHVDDARGFLSALCNITKPNGGILIISTMEKNCLTYLSHILVAEHLTGLVKPGTHDWRRFIDRDRLDKYVTTKHNIRPVDYQYIVSYPDVAQSLATRNFQVQFSLSRSVATGHYLWTGVRA
uniref:2-polyprenyl-6-hydroxyphenyl methylase/3-demethylubiquinone-9 3-methyltransferase n=1 Tax=Strigomonas galati TaxID=1003336 RepID=T1YS66_9TRYP|nr:2-polyprenyl-6-hydroxyphenyl methylase/3-demethylubiquinone-9 3-methyltransferase [Strigomonas galati]